jgi:hypothetical protein
LYRECHEDFKHIRGNMSDGSEASKHHKSRNNIQTEETAHTDRVAGKRTCVEKPKMLKGPTEGWHAKVYYKGDQRWK